ncbi:hypothetical protein Dimus_004770 [Dionaea muscipula]
MQKTDEKPATSPNSCIDQSVVPGDVVLDLSTRSNQTIKLGGGLQQYIPCARDHVLGIVVDCRADNFLVDIKGSTLAFLPVLAFEGVIRHSIPRFEHFKII